MKARKIDVKIKRVLGNGSSSNIVTNSFLFAIILFFFILFAGSYFKPLVYPLIDRVTYSTHFINKYIIGNYYDSLIILVATFLWLLISIKGKFKYILSLSYAIPALFALYKNTSFLLDILTLFSIPIIVILIAINRRKKNKILFFDKQICINYISILGILLGVLSVSLSIARLFNLELSLPSNYLYYIFLLSSIFTPILLIFISILFPIKLLVIKLVKRHLKNKDTDNYDTNLSLPQHLKLKTRLIIFCLIVILSVAVTIIPHIYTINKDNQPIGDDTKDYIKMLNPIKNSSNLQEFLNQIFIVQMSGDRPFSLISFLLWSDIVNPSNLINSLDYLPLFLGPFLILSIYLLTMELTSNHFTALLASFLTVTSFHILVGTYAGIYSNWLSLIFGYLAFLFMFRSLKKPNKSNVFSFSILMIVTLLSHVPTWTILMMVIVALLIITLKLKFYDRNSIVYLLLALIPSLIIDNIRMLLIKSSGVVEDISFANSQGAGVHNLSVVWINLVNTTQTYMAGLFGNSIILILTIFWLYKCNIKDKPTLLIVIFLSLTILPIFLGEQQIQTRFLFELPFQIPAAIALTHIRKNHGNILFSVICLWTIAIAIRASSNFYLVQH